MLIQNNTKQVKDVFHAFLVKNARFDGLYEIPCIKPTNKDPNTIIPFSKIGKETDFNKWVCFYEDDEKINAFWNNPKKYLEKLKKFNGVISPDYSLYRDLPFSMQVNNTYQGKALGHWLQENGVEVIPNVRWGDERSYDLACMGVPKNSIIAVGTHGCIKEKEEKQWFIKGLDYVVKELKPKTIVVYGREPDYIFSLIKMYGIKVLSFESDFSLSHKKEVN